MSGATADAIRAQGLGFLKDARQGRGYTEKTDRSFSRYSYQPWQATPLAPEWTSNGPWLGLSCMHVRDGTVRGILNAAQTAGSVYTTGPDKMLLMVPSLNLVVYTYTR